MNEVVLKNIRIIRRELYSVGKAANLLSACPNALGSYLEKTIQHRFDLYSPNAKALL
jgi:hypothetical protein